MVVIDELPGIKVTVQVSGQDAVEYDDLDGLENDVNRKHATHRTFNYVESKDDAYFSLRYEVDNRHRWESPDRAFSFVLYIDGKRMDGVVCEATRFHQVDPFYKWSTVAEGSRERISVSRCERLSKFKFSKVTTIDDATKERVEGDSKKSKSLGVIEVFIYPMVITGLPHYTESGRPDTRNTGFDIAEKALKGRAVSHGTSFTDGGVVAQRICVRGEFLNGGDPIACFMFKYRSRGTIRRPSSSLDSTYVFLDALQKELIIPRTPSPEAIDELSEAEIRRLAAERLDELNNGRRSNTVKRESKGPIIKREYAEVYDLTEEPTKREWKKVKIDANREAIDLTDD
ncbi:hypothetical protein CORC01_07034 [Colletotrichum orchidophilum]|uniref:DUF7918 domain-containing protein n=1 Tax=Colletotrichum orchidophilum TaxID=1209926 RepID=A0A1G4B849_9PEZI|nr:uncharacterized protein CORC01_07034 [Colletotrichum orchidophilum]OHE97619.1 hypothetical protein CORC01_07034 [Colletotrichum orchidophilum]